MFQFSHPSSFQGTNIHVFVAQVLHTSLQKNSWKQDSFCLNCITFVLTEILSSRFTFWRENFDSWGDNFKKTELSREDVRLPSQSKPGVCQGLQLHSQWYQLFNAVIRVSGQGGWCLCVVTPSSNDPNSRREHLLSSFFFFSPSFKPDLLPLEWPLQAPASGWKGGVNGFLFLLPSRPVPSHPFPSSAVQITWLGEAEGKGVSNAKCLERNVSIVCMIPISGRSKAQGREEQKEKSPISREMLMLQTHPMNGKDTSVSWKI